MQLKLNNQVHPQTKCTASLDSHHTNHQRGFSGTMIEVAVALDRQLQRELDYNDCVHNSGPLINRCSGTFN